MVGPVITSILAYWQYDPNHTAVPVWAVAMAEGHRGMNVTTNDATCEEAEAAALAQFIERFPNRLEST